MPSYILRDLDPFLWSQFKAAAQRKGWPLRALFLSLMDDFANDRIEPTSSAPLPPTSDTSAVADIPRQLDKGEATALFLGVLRRLGYESDYDVAVFRGGPDSDWRAELQAKSHGTRPLGVQIRWNEGISRRDLQSKISRAFDETHT